MEIIQSAENLTRNTSGLLFRVLSSTHGEIAIAFPLNRIEEFPALAQLHDKLDLLIGFKHVQQLNDKLIALHFSKNLPFFQVSSGAKTPRSECFVFGNNLHRHRSRIIVANRQPHSAKGTVSQHTAAPGPVQIVQAFQGSRLIRLCHVGGGFAKCRQCQPGLQHGCGRILRGAGVPRQGKILVVVVRDMYGDLDLASSVHLGFIIVIHNFLLLLQHSNRHRFAWIR
mmetsp:Transcript_14128/g.30790  ORF Transcript_14128/g.30790 Transcript_14128/m.30790 type:complete len:226 (-) Transcript_14128:166-843(-)